MKRFLAIIFLIQSFLSQAQITSEPDSSFKPIDPKTIRPVTIIEGDTIPWDILDEVLVISTPTFDNDEARRRYYILRRKVIKVYPYAKLAAERLQTMQQRMDGIKRKSAKKKYAKRIQKYIEEEFSEELKKLTRTEGQILVKLIHRQTGKTAFDLIKELRSGWRAFWFNSTAKFFNISLKQEFDPENKKEDYLIEDILQRNFQSGNLEEQEPAIEFDFYELTDKWLGKKDKP